MNQTKPEKRMTALSIRVPALLHEKIKFIKEKTFLSKQQIILMSASNTIEDWCEQIKQKEIQERMMRAEVNRIVSPPPPLYPKTKGLTEFPTEIPLFNKK